MAKAKTKKKERYFAAAVEHKDGITIQTDIVIASNEKEAIMEIEGNHEYKLDENDIVVEIIPVCRIEQEIRIIPL